jgi:hypothetical protein
MVLDFFGVNTMSEEDNPSWDSIAYQLLTF